MRHRIYNFSAGPAMLPEQVLQEVQQELMNYRGSGMSVMELSHRGKVFREILETGEEALRELLQIPQEYAVLFLQGGGTQQFAMIPMNLAQDGAGAYLIGGYWSRKAYDEARKLGCGIIAGASPEPFVPTFKLQTPLPEHTKYLYFCENETIQGTRMPTLPKAAVPLISDQSSMFLSQPCDVSQYGMIFAGVQKNVGPAGLAIVIIRRDLIRENLTSLPACLSYDLQSKAGSLYNTPNCWSIYVCGKVFQYLIDNGGLGAAEERNREKAALLYSFLDGSNLFKPFVREPYRSRMNVTFSTGSHSMDRKLIQLAEEAGIVGLAGHKSQGGLRASIYNAMPLSGVTALVRFLERFEKEEGFLSGS